MMASGSWLQTIAVSVTDRTHHPIGATTAADTTLPRALNLNRAGTDVGQELL
jgi:hypothetical protein